MCSISAYLRRSNRRRRGATVVEFGIVVPFFLLFLMGAYEFGRLHVVQHTADNAAYEAARHAIVPGATAAEAVSRANRLMRIVGARDVAVTVNPATLGPEVDNVTVTVDVPLARNGWVVPKFTSATTLRGESTMRTERPGD